MIFARSPYFYLLSTGGLSPIRAKLTISVYVGSNFFGTPYIIDKPVNSSIDTVIFEISNIVREVLQASKDVYTSQHNDSCFVQLDWEMFEEGSTLPDGEGSDKFVGYDGYGYFQDGQNPQNSPIAFNRIFSKDDQSLKLPVIIDGTFNKVDVLFRGEIVRSIDVSSNITSTNSRDKIEYIEVFKSHKGLVESDGGIYEENCCNTTLRTYNITTIELKNDDDVVHTVNIDNYTEFQNQVRFLKFYDKNGTLQEIPMLGASSSSISVERETSNINTFVDNGGINSLIYDPNRHSIAVNSSTSNETETLNSGWVREEHNEIFRQVMLSHFCWLDERPVNVTTNSLDYSKNVNGLINYSINVEYSNNYINNIL